MVRLGERAIRIQLIQSTILPPIEMRTTAISVRSALVTEPEFPELLEILFGKV